MAEHFLTKWQQLTSLFSSCRGNGRAPKIVINEGKRNPKRSFRIFRVLRFKNSKRRTHSVKDFHSVLHDEGLLAPISIIPELHTIPVLNICLGFTNEELTKRKRIVYHSYSKSKWDSILAIKEDNFLVKYANENDPIVDGLPASAWMECMEPSLVALVSLSRLKRRKTNIMIKRSPAVRHRREFGWMHRGDTDRLFWNAPFIGPQLMINAVQQVESTTTTAEVRPSPRGSDTTYLVLALNIERVKESRKNNKRSKLTILSYSADYQTVD